MAFLLFMLGRMGIVASGVNLYHGTSDTEEKHDKSETEEKPKEVRARLEVEILNRLTDISKERGITVEELIRAVIIPEWLRDRRNHHPSERKIQLLEEKKE